MPAFSRRQAVGALRDSIRRSRQKKQRQLQTLSATQLQLQTAAPPGGISFARLAFHNCQATGPTRFHLATHAGTIGMIGLPLREKCLMARASWEGFLKINLVSIPVKAFTASQRAGGRIGFNQIHAKCHSRIRHKKVCPVHGEVDNDEIVPGFEYSKGEYVLMDKKEMQQLKLDNEKAVHLDAFVAPEELPPLFFSDRTYYLGPDGKLA
jgi:hypothetical protein